MTAALIVLTLAACGPPASQPELTDPRVIIVRTIQATSGLRTMRVRLDAELRDSSQQAPQGGAVDAVVDVAAGEVSATGAARDGTGQFGVIVADGFLFATSSNGRWMKTPMVGALPLMLFGGGGGPAPNVPAVLLDLADDPETDVRLEGTIECDTGRCYHTRVVLPQGQVWKLVVGLTGIDRAPNGNIQQPPLDQIPVLGFDILTDTATVRLVEAVMSGTLNDTTITVRVRIANPNEAVDINAPPPALVDDPGDTIGGGGVATAAPVPAPVPVPASPVPAP